MAGPIEASEGVKFATTPEILEEVHDPTIRVRISGWLDAHILQPMEPGPDPLKQAKQAAAATGDLRVLSANDLTLLGLALELAQAGADANVTLVCSDFAMQNTARRLNIKVDTITKGIKAPIQWQWYCPACKKVAASPDPAIKECDVCGTPLKRRDAARALERQRARPAHGQRAGKKTGRKNR